MATLYNKLRLLRGLIKNIMKVTQINMSLKKWGLILLLSSISHLLFSQLSLGNDTVICGNQPLTIINDDTANVGVNTITLNNPTTLSLSDDYFGPMVNIGFIFNFFGQNYGQVAIGSNGILSFSSSNAYAYCAWSISGITFPNNSLASTSASFMGCYQDIDPSITTNTLQPQISYQTIGTAPNRKFVVLYKNIYFFSCTSVCNYMAFILYEGSNILEAHIGNKPICYTWGSGVAAQGVQNQSGTVAIMTPGRNTTQWSANQDARRWTPTTPSNTNSYTISTIPYSYVTTSTSNLSWFSTASNTQSYATYNTNGILTVNVSTLPVGKTGFYIQGDACGSGLGAISDTSWVTKTQTNVSATSISDTCSNGVGSALATATPSSGVFTYQWIPGNMTTAQVNHIMTGPYTVTVTDTFGCSASASVTVNNIVPTYTSSSTLVSCPNGNDGTATIIPNINSSGNTYNWFEVGQSTATATQLSEGTYHCEIISSGNCTDTVAVTVTTVPPMNITLVNSTNVDCYNKHNGKATVNVSGGNVPYTYSWSNSSSTSAQATDLMAGNNYVVVHDNMQCVDTLFLTLTQPNPLSISSIIPDTMICKENTINLFGTATGGSSPYIYDWFTSPTSGGNPYQVGNNSQFILVNPSYNHQQYILRVSEQCGSQPAYDTVTITFPTDILPKLLVDKTQACQPGTFVFSNDTSATNMDINTYFINFGNGTDTLVSDSFNIAREYKKSGYHDIILNAISNYGCNYKDTLKHLIWVAPKPKANYNADKNPTTIFNTTVQLLDNSSTDVVNWQWYVPGSEEVNSHLRYPQFKFPEGNVGDYPVQLVVTTELGCTDTVRGIIHVISDVIFYAPNSFTPNNGDEFNNQFIYYIDGVERESFSMTIYNRWGEVVWESHDPDVFWDGTYKGVDCPSGTYIYIASAKNILNGHIETFKGHINILR